MELSTKYNPTVTEAKWLKFWKDKNIFHAKVDSGKKPFTIMIPPPNVTGILHMGHALNNILQDIVVRYKRMNGFETLWMPGTDHAGIATQNVVEKQLAKEGQTRQDLGRGEFLKRLWAWQEKHGDAIIDQLEKLGSSCDWARARFTMDDAYSDAVNEAFIQLYNDGLIYQDKRIINWCPRCQTALSDEEVEHKEKNGKLYYIRYPFKDNPKEAVVVATTRPETMLGDTAVAVNSKDKRYEKLIGKVLVLPILERKIKVIADDFVAVEFGTGVVKVTPAHDSNDFAMGRRHNLEFINIMHPDGRLNEKAGPFSGLDRFDTRKKLLAQLESEGYLVKVEDHKLSIGHCYRCDTTVEPYLSKQWFVRMTSLAKPALEAVKNETIKIYPEHWKKVYINWMENIHDWCISRQIWWGHRIPIWYTSSGEHYAANDLEQAKIQTGFEHYTGTLKQDEDVLDTWFSSWLWPFATLGWPEKNPDLNYFYPTNMLFTASEIIFFWVARMIMAGYKFMEEPPFTQVYIHGTVRDAKGRKMAKSLGNAIDPLEIIDEYGCDALRFSLIINSGQDIFISKEKFEIGRNFANKIWNASRLVFMNCSQTLEKGDYEALNQEHLDLPSRWILYKFQAVLTIISESIESFRYSEAENYVQNFFWADYCDWYLELIKAKWSDVGVQKTALFILKNSLKIIHPFMPFVTEEIYSKMNSKDKCLSLAPWPQKQEKLIDAKASAQMQMIIDIISAIRNIRAQWNIKPNETVDAFIISNDPVLVAQNSIDIKRLARLKNLSSDLKAPLFKNAATALVGTIRIFIPLEGLIDLNAEKERMSTEIALKQRSIDSKQLRLSNEAFVSKAPQEVITSEKKSLDSLIKEVSALESILSNLS